MPGIHIKTGEWIGGRKLPTPGRPAGGSRHDKSRAQGVDIVPAAPAGAQQTSGETSAEATSQTQRRIDFALRQAVEWNTGWSRSKVLRLIRRYEREVEPNGHTLFDYLINAAKLTATERHDAYLAALKDPDNQVIFRDPVGEEAVRNVLKQRGY